MTSRRWCAVAAVMTLAWTPLAAAQAEPLVDLAKQTFEGAKPAGGGQAFSLDLGQKRSNWNTAQWSVLAFDAPRDLSKFGGIKLTVTTEKPRTDAGVYIALKEADGSWYYYPWACDLAAKSNSGTALFEDFTPAEWTSPGPGGGKFFDENGRLDLKDVSAVAIGCINPLGVGTLAFTVTGLDLVPAAAAAAGAVKIDVTGKTLDVNGTTMIPAGVFGSFNLPKGHAEKYRLAQTRTMMGKEVGTAAVPMVINVAGGDRGAASPRATNAKWEQDAAAAGKAMAELPRPAGAKVYAEYYNEPYLNWANKNRVAFNPALYDESKATEGGPVTIKIDGQVAPHLKWTQNYDAPPWQWVTPRYSADGRDNWRRGKDASGKMVSRHAEPPPWSKAGWSPETHPPKDVKDGEKYTAKTGKKGQEKEIELTAFTPWYVYDETQFTYWSARGMLKFYIEPMLAFAKAFKGASPDTVMIAGWGNRAMEDHWAAFELLYKPTIDAAWEVIDGLCDHDYGGSATKMAANYEVVTAYGQTKYGKWLHGYNTECAMGSDPQAYAGAGGEANSAGADIAKGRWTAAKILSLLSTCPDKVRSIAWFGDRGTYFWSDGGEGVVMEALKPLRGRLIQALSSDPQVYAVASVDGTDPLAPRPKELGEGKELVLAVFNHEPHAVTCDIAFTPPAGTKLAGPISATRLGVIDGKWQAVKGEAKLAGVTLEPSSALVLTAPLSGDLPAGAQVVIRQFFAKTLLVDVTPDKPLTETVAVDAAALKGVKRAWVKVAVERLGEGEGVVSVNGKDYPLPRAITPENGAEVRYVAIDPATLKDQNQVVFKAVAPHAGYFLCMGSLVVESEP